MAEAYIIDGSPNPRRQERRRSRGAVHSADLGAHVIKALMTQRTGFRSLRAVEDVIFGCCDTVGSQAGDIARTCWLAAGLPEHVPGRDDRPSMRIVPTIRPLRSAGRH